jgi:riboflavin kinase/FMN adenylyltransferase
MRLFRHYTEVPVEARGAVVALGNFDGVHRGHQSVVGEAARRAGELGVSHAVLTVEPHPREFFQPAQPPFRLTPFRIKVRQFEAMGVDSLFVLTFDAELARKSAEAFVVEVLGEGLGAAHAVVGYDFVFGHGRRGDAALLRDLGAIQGFGTTVVDPARAATGEPFSSTRVREALAAGDPLAAAAHLGRPWEIEGRVEHGDRRGHGLGFPTANLPLGDYLQPALGIYAIEAGIDEGPGTTWRDGVGCRPASPSGDLVVGASVRFRRRSLAGICAWRSSILSAPTRRSTTTSDCAPRSPPTRPRRAGASRPMTGRRPARWCRCRRARRGRGPTTSWPKAGDHGRPR